jgi:HK97 gp10 family phage protein
MPYTLKVEGMEEITAMLAKAEGAAQGIAALALYDGAGVVADEISRGARGISTSPFRYAAGGRMRDPSPEERDALVSAGAAGIAKFRKTGNSVDTSVGYGRSGYVSINGKTKPAAVIANAINSGTSFMKKQPFIRKALNKAKDQATEVITQKVTSLVEEILK